MVDGSPAPHTLYPLPCLWLAAERLLPHGASEAWRAGMTGLVAHSVLAPWTAEDLRGLILPGLAALGIRAELAPLPDDDRALQRLLRERLRRGISPVLIGGVPGTTQAETHEAHEAGFAAQSERVNQTGASRGGAAGQPGPMELGGATREEPAACVATFLVTAEESLPAVAELRARFSHVVRLLRGSPARRRAAVRDAVLRWIAFSDAYPQRAVSEGPADRDALALSSGFLREAAGKKRDPVAVRLRRAAVAFAAGDVQTGLYWLRYAALADLRLAAAPQSALLERDRPLTSIERRELVYLARAGTPLMRVLAARRLCDESAQPDVRATLQVLRCDPEAWVRAAAACW